MSTLIMGKVWPLRMSSAQKAVAISLADQANDSGVCWPSVSTLSNRTCLSERAVQAALRDLETLRFLARIFRQGHSTHYHLT
ncbi:helix-turn-helix domain-containing protein, partial [Nevskia sp.]|uniref:helix-turn-helix domain-containing protein n=1 Tax=Nevskia sp. TaxID=1929292 RepID=UPI0025D5C197